MTSDQIQCIRLTPPRKCTVAGKYDVDHFALEANQAGEVIDLRLELGLGYETLWLVPTEPCGHLRLFHINYITCDDDPYVRADPCPVDFGPFEWQGELATLGSGGLLVRVAVEMHEAPSSYECLAEVRMPDGTMRSFRLAYTAPLTN